jgi:hypothetical protein
MIDENFYYQTPIDFEYHQYLILDYSSKVDASYALHILSPYLLHTEKIIKNITIFRNNLNTFEKSLHKDIISFDNFKIEYSTIDKPNELNTILEIIEFSLPILNDKLKLGYKLFKKYPQLLY